MLGSFVSLWWHQRQDPICDWCWCLSPACGASPVCSILHYNFLLYDSLSYYMFTHFCSFNIVYNMKPSITFSAYTCTTNCWKYCHRRWLANSGIIFVLFFGFTTFCTNKLLWLLSSTLKEDIVIWIYYNHCVCHRTSDVTSVSITYIWNLNHTSLFV